MKRTPEEIMERMDALLDEYEGAKDKYDRGCFADKYGERLGQYSDKLKALNGDEFDIVSSAYDEHKNDYSDMSDDDYVNALEDNIKKVIARVWPEAPEEVKEEVAEQVSEAVENPDGETTETHIETEDKNGDGEISEDEIETHTLTSDEESKEEPKDEEEKTEETAEKVAEATPTKVDDAVVEVATAKPEEVEGTELEEAYTFDKNDPIWKKFH